MKIYWILLAVLFYHSSFLLDTVQAKPTLYDLLQPQYPRHSYGYGHHNPNQIYDSERHGGHRVNGKERYSQICRVINGIANPSCNG